MDDARDESLRETWATLSDWKSFRTLYIQMVSRLQNTNDVHVSRSLPTGMDQFVSIEVTALIEQFVADGTLKLVDVSRNVSSYRAAANVRWTRSSAFIHTTQRFPAKKTMIDETKGRVCLYS
jgi:hypothetical protein